MALSPLRHPPQSFGARSRADVAQLATCGGVVGREFPSDQSHHRAGQRRVTLVGAHGREGFHEASEGEGDAVGDRAQAIDREPFDLGDARPRTLGR